ncbi:TPA: restriction endonuclease subunit S [Enterobacter chengduensis]|nr:restriction endonuclease subunit S [Enterobacter chengduensis]
MGFDFQSLENAGIQLIDGDRGKNYPKHNDFMENGYCLFLSAKNVTKSGFQFQEITFINKIKDSQLRAGKLTYGDIILTTRGTVGNVAYYDSSNPYKHIRINSGMIIIRADKELWNPKFLYFILTSVFLQEQISNLISGSAVPQLPARDIKKFILPIFPKKIQDKITNIISAFSDKININININQSLEEISKTLFKSWFVDFDPVIDNALDAGNPIPEPLQSRAELRQKARNSADFKPLPADIRALFPAEFEETKMGWVPKKWKNGNLSDVTKILSGFAFKSKDFGDDGKSVIKIKNITTAKTIDIDDTQKVSEFIAKDANRFLLLDGDILMAMTGATVGKFGILTTQNNEEYYLNQRVAKFETENKAYLYCVLNQESTDRFITNTAQGSAQPNISAKDILSTPLLIPSVELINTFNNFINHLFYRIIANTKANFNLTTLRDTLLPKLISGELSLEDLPDLIKQTEPA